MSPNNTDIVPAKQTEITTEKAEYSVLHSDEFLITALKDLEASELLYRNELYSQAISLLQQAVEKGLKSLGIHFRLPKSDPKENYHNPLKMVTEEVESQRRRYNKILKNTEKVDKINLSLQCIGITVEDYATIMEKVSIFINKIVVEQSHEYNISNEKLTSLINDMKKIELIMTYTHDLSPEEMFQITNIVIDITPQILDKNLILRYDTDDISLEQKQQNIIDTFEKIKKMDIPLDFCQGFCSMLFLVAGSAFLFFVLSLITTPHAARARYPQLDEGLDPAEYYTDELPLIQHLPELYKYTHIALDWLEELYDRDENLSLNPEDGYVD